MRVSNTPYHVIRLTIVRAADSAEDRVAELMGTLREIAGALSEAEEEHDDAGGAVKDLFFETGQAQSERIGELEKKLRKARAKRNHWRGQAQACRRELLLHHSKATQAENEELKTLRAYASGLKDDVWSHETHCKELEEELGKTRAELTHALRKYQAAAIRADKESHDARVATIRVGELEADLRATKLELEAVTLSIQESATTLLAEQERGFILAREYPDAEDLEDAFAARLEAKDDAGRDDD